MRIVHVIFKNQIVKGVPQPLYVHQVPVQSSLIFDSFVFLLMAKCKNFQVMLNCIY